MATIWIREGTVLPERRQFDFYPTPADKVQHGLELVQQDLRESLGTGLRTDPRILDPGAGDGVWGRECAKLWPDSYLVGVELREGCYDPRYDHWITGDFHDPNVLATSAHEEFDLVVGNPPYRHATHFVEKSLSLLRHGGRLLFLLRLAFLESQKRGTGLFLKSPPKRVVVCMRRPSFTGDGKTNSTAFAFFLWEKGFQGETRLSWK